MDKVSVTDAALGACSAALGKLKDTVAVLTSECNNALTGLSGDLETNYKSDIIRFTAALQKLRDRVIECANENMAAIAHRRQRLAEYASCGYKSRNIG